MKTLLRQGLPIRGHNDVDSNIRQFNEGKAISNEGLRLFLKDNLYMSHDVLTEQEELIVLNARRQLLFEITTKTAVFYSIICKESSNIAKTEQLSFSVHYCTDTYDIREDFIGVFPCDKGLKSEALFGYIDDILTQCSMDKREMVGMSFDGASSMNSLAMMIKETMSQHAMCFHCFAYCTELLFKDGTLQSSLLGSSQDLCEDLYALVGVIAKRVLLFQKIQEEIERDYSTMRLKNLSRTRWTTRGPAAEVIVKKHNELCEVLSKLKEDSSLTLKCKAKA